MYELYLVCLYQKYATIQNFCFSLFLPRYREQNMQCHQKHTPQASQTHCLCTASDEEIGKTVLAPYFGECIEPARTKTCCWRKPNLTFVQYREYCICK